MNPIPSSNPSANESIHPGKTSASAKALKPLPKRNIYRQGKGVGVRPGFGPSQSNQSIISGI